jgi:hypothetical protein
MIRFFFPGAVVRACVLLSCVYWGDPYKSECTYLCRGEERPDLSIFVDTSAFSPFESFLGADVRSGSHIRRSTTTTYSRLIIVPATREGRSWGGEEDRGGSLTHTPWQYQALRYSIPGMTVRFWRRAFRVRLVQYRGTIRELLYSALHSGFSRSGQTLPKPRSVYRWKKSDRTVTTFLRWLVGSLRRFKWLVAFVWPARLLFSLFLDDTESNRPNKKLFIFFSSFSFIPATMAFLLKRAQVGRRKRFRTTAQVHVSWVWLVVVLAGLRVDLVQGGLPLLDPAEWQDPPPVVALPQEEGRQQQLRGGHRPATAASATDGPIALYSGLPHHAVLLESTATRQRQLNNGNNKSNRPPKFPDLTGPTIPDISGPFEIEIKLRINAFDSFEGYATIVNFSNGGQKDGIYVGAFGNPNMLSLLISNKSGKWVSVTANNVVVLGQEQTYLVGADANGTMWINVNGTRRASNAVGIVPENVVRSQKSLGTSSDFRNTRPLNGAILGLRVTNKDENERDMSRRQFLTNLPGQFFGAFRAGLYVRVDNTSTTLVDQGIMDLYTTNGVDNVRIVCNRSTMRFDLYQGGTVYSIVTATNSVVAGEMALWIIGVDDSNLMYLEKNGTRLGSRTIPTLAKVFRRTTVFGNLGSGTAPLDGVALAFRTETAIVS